VLVIHLPLCISLFDKSKGGERDNTTPIRLSLLFAFIGATHILLTFGMIMKKKPKVEKTKEPLNVRIKKNMSSIKKIFSVSLALLLLSITLQGIHRQALTSFFELYTKECGLERKHISYAFVVRVFPEASMLFLTPRIDKAIGTYWMIFIGIFFGVFRPIFYSCVDQNNLSEFGLKCAIYACEISKGVFSGLFNYSCSKLVKDMSTKETRSLAQGLYAGCYSGMAPCIQGMIAYAMLEQPKLTIQGSNVRFLFLFTGILGLVGFIPMVMLIMKKIREDKKLRSHVIEAEDLNSSTVKSTSGELLLDESVAA